MTQYQQTIHSEIIIKGQGIHSGKKVTLILKPAPENTGIQFIRTDLNNQKINVIPKNITSTHRATVLTENNVNIATPEHLLAACFGCNIHNLYIEIDNEEVPILDGSALEFSTYLTKEPPIQQSSKKEVLIIKNPIKISDKDSYIEALPHPTTKFSYTLDYPDSFVGSQEYSCEFTQKHFLSEIAPARTYGFLNEVTHLLEQGLAKGGSLENAVVIGETDYLSPLRFPNELARHKLLDMIGDLSILGKSIQGHIIGHKSGHKLNKDLVIKIASKLIQEVKTS